MSKILLSIKPEFAFQIINKQKTFEYRKNKIKRGNINTIIIYVTSPVKKIIGEVEILDILEGTPAEIWSKTNASGGISKKKFDNYYEGRNRAFAYVLGNVRKYEQEKELKEFNIKQAPQSYIYID